MFSRTLHSRLLSMLLSAALTSLVLSTLFSTTLTRPVCAQDAAGHFHYAGPLSKFQVEGATPGAVAGGLPFTVTVADNGATITPSSFDLKGPQWNSAAKLTLDGLKYAGGKLTATARIQNGSGSVLEGVRLDITGATEEYKAKDAQ